MKRSCAITRSPYLADDELWPWMLRLVSSSDVGCRIRGWPFVESYFDGCTIHTTLPTMEAGLWQYDPFLRPLAHGWKRKPRMWVLKETRTYIVPNSIDSVGDGWD